MIVVDAPLKESSTTRIVAPVAIAVVLVAVSIIGSNVVAVETVVMDGAVTIGADDTLITVVRDVTDGTTTMVTTTPTIPTTRLIFNPAMTIEPTALQILGQIKIKIVPVTMVSHSILS